MPEPAEQLKRPPRRWASKLLWATWAGVTLGLSVWAGFNHDGVISILSRLGFSGTDRQVVSHLMYVLAPGSFVAATATCIFFRAKTRWLSTACGAYVASYLTVWVVLIATWPEYCILLLVPALFCFVGWLLANREA
jgi:hypothetical protein